VLSRPPAWHYYWSL